MKANWSLATDSEEHSHFCHGEYINHRAHPSLLNTHHFLQSYNFAKDEHKAAQIKSIVKLNTCMLELGNVSLIPTRSTANLKAEKILIKV